MNADAVDALLRDSHAAGLFLDFDGTLSEIVPVPEDARPLPGAVELLERLGRRFRTVAIVSGRSGGQLLEWLGPDVEIWGVHGGERTLEGRVEVSEKVAPFQEQVRRAFSDAEEELARRDLPGVGLEDKGVVIGLHFRGAGDEAADQVRELADALAQRHDLVRLDGRRVVELRPPVELSKKSVVLERARQLSLEAAAFIGDDAGDVEAFDALDELAQDGLVTLRVAVRSPESPPELLERGDLVVDGPEGAVEFLESLL